MGCVAMTRHRVTKAGQTPPRRTSRALLTALSSADRLPFLHRRTDGLTKAPQEAIDDIIKILPTETLRIAALVAADVRGAIKHGVEVRYSSVQPAHRNIARRPQSAAVAALRTVNEYKFG